MKESIMMVVRTYRDFNDTGMYMALFFCALLYLWYHDQNHQLRRMWIYPSIIFFILIINPFIMKYVIDLAFDYASRPRVYWLLPITIVIAIAATVVVSARQNAREKTILAIAICLIFMICGKFKYTNGYFGNPTNAYDLPQAAVDIADYALEQTDSPKLVVPIDLATAMRIYSPEIRLLYGEDVVFGRIQYMGPSITGQATPQYEVYQHIVKDEPEIAECINIIKDLQCDYVVFDREQQSGYKIIERYGYEYRISIEQYDIYGMNTE